MNKKEQLLASAREVMFKKGYSSTRISDIVSDTNVAQGTFYIYFKSKEDVLVEMLNVINRDREKVLESLEGIGNGITKEKFLEEMNLVSHLFRGFIEKNADILKILAEEMNGSRLIRKHVNELRDSSKQVIAVCLKAGKSAGFLKDMDYDLVSEVVTTGIMQLMMAVTNYNLVYDSQEILDTFIKLYLFGIMKE
ncbi:MAG TPA: TetR/AcrR family transcriptional regulator [Caldisericia bacterium]|nr:TetR/AcrR family transcriptional regulator [Caldisericia bacterium]HPF48402.1 TetR/AcrR family transcriptional regulator [Caldisericia bacterium]HPI83418.1 TetR/AcrR family transcriptional regulator [Caldisericia bacterium]HPQ92856.1 TetR/AcrR family transcriptional regulator [Caldisericia bacterium]HRV74046.1 TetR/AcrR family transcriptional regulator [Caldisericia bacterium]